MSKQGEWCFILPAHNPLHNIWIICEDLLQLVFQCKARFLLRVLSTEQEHWIHIIFCFLKNPQNCIWKWNYNYILVHKQNPWKTNWNNTKPVNSIFFVLEFVIRLNVKHLRKGGDNCFRLWYWDHWSVPVGSQADLGSAETHGGIGIFRYPWPCGRKTEQWQTASGGCH